jgi:hypothetical protein
MDLREARIGKGGSALMRPPDCGGVRTFGVGREVEHVPIPARAKDNGVAQMRGDLAGDHVPHDDSARLPVHHDEIQHLGSWIYRHAPSRHFLLHLLVGAKKQLLTSLAARVERPGHLGAAE